MKKKRTLITVGAMILLLSVVTYAYYTAGISNENAQTANLNTGTMSLSFDDGDNGVAAVLNFGDTITKKFTLENTGSLDASASISWFNLVNTYLDGSLMYTLEYSENLDGEYEKVVSNLMVPTSEEPVTTPLVTQVTVPTGKTYYYNLKITLVNSEVIDQTSDINASFHTQFTIKDASSLSASEQTLANLGLVSTYKEANFNKLPNKSFKDNGFDMVNIREYEGDFYGEIYYSDAYTFNEETGKYTLINPKSGIYSEIVNDLKNAYVTNYWLYETEYYEDSTTIYKILEASYDEETEFGKYTYAVPNDITAFNYNDSGIYSMEDDYGMSYYFRGAAENNYVKFGKNSENKDMYWRIVRINGDGSLRIAYDGTQAYKNGVANKDRLLTEQLSLEEDAFEYDDEIGLWYTNFMTGLIFRYIPEENPYYGAKCIIDEETIDDISEEECAGLVMGNCNVNGEIYEDIPKSACENGDISGEPGIFTQTGGNYEYVPVPEKNKDYCLQLINNNVVDNYSKYSTQSSCEANGGKWASSKYEAETSNVKDGVLKKALDKWYRNNIYNTTYESAISDTIFCSDREADYIEEDYTYISYINLDRLENNHEPKLTCTQQNDRFTVNDKTIGNGNLTYPIGTLTADEIMMAGVLMGPHDGISEEEARHLYNEYLYLNKGFEYFTMTSSQYSVNEPDYIYTFGPTVFNGSSVEEEMMYAGYLTDQLGHNIYEEFNYVPVLNLTPEYVSQMIGDGTMGNVFRVE